MFNQAFILNAFHLLLDKLLPLTSTDLENLEDEPEEWLVAETNDEEAWAFEFRVSHLPRGANAEPPADEIAMRRARVDCTEQRLP